MGRPTVKVPNPVGSGLAPFDHDTVESRVILRDAPSLGVQPLQNFYEPDVPHYGNLILSYLLCRYE